MGAGYRAYNPALMRFHSPDSWSPFGAGGANAYAYCGGDPVNLSDPSGHLFVTSNVFSLPVRTPPKKPYSTNIYKPTFAMTRGTSSSALLRASENTGLIILGHAQTSSTTPYKSQLDTIATVNRPAGATINNVTRYNPSMAFKEFKALDIHAAQSLKTPTPIPRTVVFRQRQVYYQELLSLLKPALMPAIAPSDILTRATDLRDTDAGLY